MINKIAIISSLSPDIAINLFNFFKEGNRVAVDCVISDNSHSQEFSETLSNQGIPLFNFPVAAWESSPETILDFLRSRNISLLLVDHFDLPVPPQIREAYPRTLLSLSTISLGGEERMEAKRLFPDGTDELLISDSLDNCDTLPARAVVMAIQAPLISRPTPPANNNLPLTPEQEWAQKLNIPAPETSLPPVPDSDNTPQQPPLPYQQNDMMNQPVNNMTGPTQHPGEAPNSYLLWSILSLVFCCFIPSIVAIFYSAQVNSRFYAGDFKGSQRASRNAQIWIIVSIVLGVVSSTLYFPLMLLQ